MAPMRIVYPPELPITAKRTEIVAAVRRHRVVIVSGETGCGKSTQIPKMCLEAGRGRRGRIAVTQPRRIAAITIAHRIAEEMGETIGRTVGYKIRFEDKSSSVSVIKILTDGMLLAETQSDPRLLEYDTIVIDEAHERSLNIDFLLGIVQTLLSRRADLKLIITSATLDIEKFSEAFGEPPVIEVSGRMYPVEVEYRVPDSEEEEEDLDYVDMAAEAVDYLKKEKPPGDILVFMPTEQDILETCDILQGRKFSGTSVLPLFARLPGGQQGRVYTVTGPKIVVATNVAETSLTIPGIKYVVDTGLARISQYLPGAGINSLPIRPVSRSSADQRKGRCGRVAKGLCVRLYPEKDYEERPRFTPPEILRSNLAEVILRMLFLNLGHPSRFPFVDKPTARMVEDGFATLVELGAVRPRGPDYELTERGKRMARIPLDPRISRMLLEALEEGVLREVAVIASALSIRDPRERPPEKAREADAAHAPFRDPDSDFLTLLNIWDRFHADWASMRSTGQKRRFCHEHFLSFPRMREWAYIHDQILDILRELRLPVGPAARADISPQRYAAIHKSAASGLLSHVAVLKEKHQYTAAKGREAMLFPGSSLFAKPPGWVVAAEIVQTARVYLRTAARIEPAWLEALGGELCRYSYHDPAWDKGRGEVRANERVTLFGLEIVSGRPIPFGPIDSEASHKIFVRDGLLAGEIKEPFAFLKHNLALRARFESLEDKLRRRDIVADEKELAEFYSRRLPGIYDIKGLKNVLKRHGGDHFLRMTENDIVRYIPSERQLDFYPDSLQAGELKLRAAYKFLPGAEEDGITLRVRTDQLALLPVEPLEWGIPGAFREKIVELVQGLPQRYRKFLVPAAESADIIVREMPRGEGSLYDSLAKFVKRRFHAEIPGSAWAEVEIPKHLDIRLSVIGPDGREVVSGRDLVVLKGFKPEIPVADTASAGWKKALEKWEREGVETWDFGPLPESIPLGGGAAAYPALAPAARGAALRLFKTREEAAAIHAQGLEALLLPKFAKDLKYMERHLALPEEFERAALFFGGKAAVEKMMLESLKARVFRRDIRTPEEFESCSAGAVRALFEVGKTLLDITTRILEEYQKVRKEITVVIGKGEGRKAVVEAADRIRSDLESLVPKNFLGVYPPERLAHLPRYLEALRLRTERAKYSPDKDRKKGEEAAPFLQAYEEVLTRTGGKGSPVLAAALEDFRRAVEEFMVSLFAPEIKTAFPISAKRLAEKLRVLKSLAEAEAPSRPRPKIGAVPKIR
jgi:ATP-dependent helicase HrpA